jgi:hypothetical protein
VSVRGVIDGSSAFQKGPGTNSALILAKFFTKSVPTSHAWSNIGVTGVSIQCSKSPTN